VELVELVETNGLRQAQAAFPLTFGEDTSERNRLFCPGRPQTTPS